MKPLSKVFIISEFGKPFSWTEQYIRTVEKLGDFGWSWKIVTPNKYTNLPINVEIIDMTAGQYADLVEKKLGIRPALYISPKGIPSIHITDFYVFSGVVFEDYIKGFDFWGITNMDVVYGRLDHYLPDSYLEDCDVFSDDVNAINGVFCLWRNNEKINNLFRLLPNWKEVLGQPICPGCTGEGSHRLYVSDERGMTEVMKSVKDVVYKYPPYYPWQSYDRLEQHCPEAKLSFESDGSLYEHFIDFLLVEIDPDERRKRPGREIMYYHFNYTKTWPNIRSSDTKAL